MRRPGFEPGLPDWQSTLSTETVNGEYDKQAFVAWLQTVKRQEIDTAKSNASFVGTFLKSGKTGDEFVQSYSNSYTYNNALFAVNHYLEYTGQQKLALKQKQCTPQSLIIAPKVEEMKRVISEIKDKHVKAYIALCATVGLRPKRLLKA